MLQNWALRIRRSFDRGINYAVRHPQGEPDMTLHHQECNWRAPPWYFIPNDQRSKLARYVLYQSEHFIYLQVFYDSFMITELWWYSDVLSFWDRDTFEVFYINLTELVLSGKISQIIRDEITHKRTIIIKNRNVFFEKYILCFFDIPKRSKRWEFGKILGKTPYS